MNEPLKSSNRRASSVDGELCSLDEAGTICGQKHDSLSDLVSCSGTAGWRLRGQLLDLSAISCVPSVREVQGSLC